MTTHWRRVAIVDDGWRLEVNDPTFRASATPEYHDEIDGWRPLAHVWRWSTTDHRPWRACISGVAYSTRDYTTLDRAKAWTSRRAGVGT